MTKEEAEDYIREWCPYDRQEEIIEALEQEPKSEKVFKMRRPTPEERESVDKYVKSISKSTGVDFWNLEQEPKTGCWERVKYDSNPNIGNWHCSECNRIVCGAITAVNPVYAYKYCPNCGAKMEGGE